MLVQPKTNEARDAALKEQGFTAEQIEYVNLWDAFTDEIANHPGKMAFVYALTGDGKDEGDIAGAAGGVLRSSEMMGPLLRGVVKVMMEGSRIHALEALHDTVNGFMDSPENRAIMMGLATKRLLKDALREKLTDSAKKESPESGQGRGVSAENQ
jgi:hypothetical protein